MNKNNYQPFNIMTQIALLILTTLSAVLFFGFVIYCIRKFGLLPCYSDYGPAWAKIYPDNNPWCYVTTGMAVILMPVMLFLSEGSIWQFTGFLCAAFIAFVGCTPNYDKSKSILVLHLIFAEGGALWAILYVLLNHIQLWWLIPAWITAGGIATAITGKKYWNFWLEMAAFCIMFNVLYVIIL